MGVGYVSQFMCVLYERLSGWVLRLLGHRDQVHDVKLAISMLEPAFAEVTIKLFPIQPAPESVEVQVPNRLAKRRSRSFLFAARLRSVAKLNTHRNARKHLVVGKGRLNLKAQPKVATAKRTPALFPAKVKPATAKRPTTRIIIAKRRPTAEIIKLPVRMPMPAAPRLKRAA